MASINKVFIMGNLGKDPKIVYSNNGTKVATFSVATSYRKKDASGNTVDNTTWHPIITFGKIADIVEQYIKQGDSVFIEGRLDIRQYTDKDGNKRSSTQIVAETLQMLSSNHKQNAARPVMSGAMLNTQAVEEQPTDDLPF